MTSSDSTTSLNPNKEPDVLQDQTSGEEVELNLKKILIQTVVGILLIFVVLGIAGYLFKQPLIAFSEKFVESVGGLGVLVGFYLVDGCFVPIPNDLFTFFGYKGGLGFWWPVILATLGSLLGGIQGYIAGYMLRRTEFFQRFMNKYGAQMMALVKKYGLLALGIAAFTPLPYSFACWGSGAVRIPFVQFLLVSLLRLPRIALYLWLIQLGFISLTG